MSQSADAAYAALRQQAAKYLSGSSLELVDRAYDMAARAHEGQQRASGEPYLVHPCAVASLLTELEMDEIGLAAALLHDVVEDTPVSLRQVSDVCGPETASLVQALTKLKRIEFASVEEHQAENLRRMILAMAEDIRVIIIKLADRLHNMRTLQSLDGAHRTRIAKETLDIYAPLAHRLGIYRFKWELEDLSLYFLAPVRYRELEERVAQERKEREAHVAALMAELRATLTAHHISANVEGRPKNYYSIYEKMYGRGKTFEEIYDLIAMRVLVDTVPDCYAVLGIVHTLWHPLPGRFKDYIAVPKSNLYQSLHTTVVAAQGRPFEVQIRTHEMHRVAEYGIAAHWRYKEAAAAATSFDQKLSWLRQILEWQKDPADPKEFIESFKLDLFDDEVFVFTPKGTVVRLPAGSTPVDFAYRIHTDVGNHCVGAKVQGRIVPLDHRLKNGDIVEIMTAKGSSGPSLDWLKFVQSSSTKHRIRQWFKTKNREPNARAGRELLEREARRLSLNLDEQKMDMIAKRLNLANAEELCVALGYGGVSLSQVLPRLKELQGAAAAPPSAPPPPLADGFGKPTNGVRVKGADNLLVRFSTCCRPVPGDLILGFVTRGRGVSVHRQDCPNAKKLLSDPARVVEVVWDGAEQESYPVTLQIQAIDRPGLMADTTRAVADLRLNMGSAKGRGFKNGTALLQVVVFVRDLMQLRSLVDRLSHLPDVLAVERVIHMPSADRSAPRDRPN